MFRAVPMLHLQVQVPSRDGPAVTRQIAAQGLLHLIDIAHGCTPSSGGGPAAQELLARFRDVTRRLHDVAAALDVTWPEMTGDVSARASADFAIELQQIDEQLAPVGDEAEALRSAATAARDRAAGARAALADAQRLRDADVDIDRLRRLRFATVQFAYADANELAALSGLLSPAPFALVRLESDARAAAAPQHRAAFAEDPLRRAQVSGGRHAGLGANASTTRRSLAAIAVPTSGRERLNSALRVSTIETLSLPKTSIDVQSLAGELATAERDEQAATEGLAALGRRAAPLVRELAQRAEVATLLVQAETCFATSGRFLIISGWIPEERSPELIAAIGRVTEGRAVVAVDKPSDLPAAYASTLRVPILHRNPVLLRPFQQLVQIYGVPSYTEVQPTAFFAVSFLLMFGLMFGDVGHGLVLFAAGYCAFRWLPRFLDYAILLMEAGVASSMFGVLYGSVFGVEHLLPALWLHPIRDLPHFMGIAVGLGIVLVSGGLLLNVVNRWRAGERIAALVDTRGLFGAFVYWTVLALAARALLPGTFVVPDRVIFILLLAAAAMLAARPLLVRRLTADRPERPRVGNTPPWLTALEAAIELVDAVFSYFANTISFIRVAAFAAVHAGVFVAMFALADTLAQYRFGGSLSAFALVAGNAVMILLEGLTVTVQVLRLEYYEFFGKFFRGGGEPYRPLMLRSNGTQGGT